MHTKFSRENSSKIGHFEDGKAKWEYINTVNKNAGSNKGDPVP
jgi:hypothetical protein